MPKRVGAQIERRLIYLANEHREWTAGQLEVQIRNECGLDVASERWIRTRLPRWRDKSTWMLASDSTGRPDVVLRVLAALREASNGGITRIGQDDARWIVKIAEAAPRLLSNEPLERRVFALDGNPALEMLFFAQNYRVADDAGDTAELLALDAELADRYVKGAD